VDGCQLIVMGFAIKAASLDAMAQKDLVLVPVAQAILVVRSVAYTIVAIVMLIRAIEVGATPTLTAQAIARVCLYGQGVQGLLLQASFITVAVERMV